jgi:hypothetical protein
VKWAAKSDSISFLTTFSRQARRDDISVAGGMPSVPEPATPSARTLDQLRKLFESEGQYFISLPNLSRYPLSCFFDTLYHLNEACQKAHSRAIALQLAELLATTGAP